MGDGQKRAKQGCSIALPALLAFGVGVAGQGLANQLATFGGPFNGIATCIIGISGCLLIAGGFIALLSGMWAVIGWLDSTKGK